MNLSRVNTIACSVEEQLVVVVAGVLLGGASEELHDLAIAIEELELFILEVSEQLSHDLLVHLVIFLKVHELGSVETVLLGSHGLLLEVLKSGLLSLLHLKGTVIQVVAEVQQLSRKHF